MYVTEKFAFKGQKLSILNLCQMFGKGLCVNNYFVAWTCAYDTCSSAFDLGLTPGMSVIKASSRPIMSVLIFWKSCFL